MEYRKYGLVGNLVIELSPIVRMYIRSGVDLDGKCTMFCSYEPATEAAFCAFCTYQKDREHPPTRSHAVQPLVRLLPSPENQGACGKKTGKPVR